MKRFPIFADIFERVVATFGVVLATFLTSDALNWQDVLQLDNWKGWATAALAAAFTTLKAAVATQISKRQGQATSASLAPSVQLQPTGSVPVVE